MDLYDPSEFPHLSGRLNFIDLFENELDNIEFWHFLTAIEEYIFGANIQYSRIYSEITKLNSRNEFENTNIISQLKLDVYYYILTWDKIKKIFIEKIKPKINQFIQESNNKEFIKDYRLLRDKIEKNLNTQNDFVRNELEHPSLEFESENSENIIAWGSIYQKDDGSIKVHIGGNTFAEIRKIYLTRLNEHWLKFVDMFIKHFSNKPLSEDLLKIKTNIEENIDKIIPKKDQQIKDGVFDNKTEIFNHLITVDIFLAKEGVSLNKSTKKKIYSMTNSYRTTS